MTSLQTSAFTCRSKHESMAQKNEITVMKVPVPSQYLQSTLHMSRAPKVAYDADGRVWKNIAKRWYFHMDVTRYGTYFKFISEPTWDFEKSLFPITATTEKPWPWHLSGSVLCSVGERRPLRYPCGYFQDRCAAHTPLTRRDMPLPYQTPCLSLV
jgi:hypothetical protein